MAVRVRPHAKRNKKLSAPANDEELAEFAGACSKADTEPADTLRKLAKAFKLHVDEYGGVTFPIRLAPPSGKK